MLNNTCILVYTNESYQPIADLSIGEFDRFFPENPIKRYVVSNSFKEYEFKNIFNAIKSISRLDKASNQIDIVMCPSHILVIILKIFRRN